MTLTRIRRYNSFLLSVGLFYLLQNYTLGQLDFFKSLYLVGPILVKEVLFIFSSIALSFLIFDWKSNK